jgi:hypothetical protein
MGYINPLLRLNAAQQLLELPADADRQAEHAWRKRKGPMAAYWRAVATYARHTAHALNAGAAGRAVASQKGPR